MPTTAAWNNDTCHGKPLRVYVPARGTPRFGVIALPDRDDAPLAETVPTDVLDELKLLCVVPSGACSWWVDRPSATFDATLSGEQFLLDHVVPEMGARWNLFPRALGLFGVGVGGQGALRLAFRHAAQFPVAAAVVPTLDFHDDYHSDDVLSALYDSKEHARQDTAILHVPPDHAPPHLAFCCDPRDRRWRGADRLHEKLTALGVAHQADLDETPGENWITPKLAPLLRFVHRGLEAESRRLL
jgi:S-formylglutathione hydrolase